MASILKVDKLDPQSGTALEIGTSGDTITVPSGATLDISSATLTPPATLPASSGVNLTALNASNLGSGTVPTARLGSGTASSSTILYGDQTYKTEPASGGITEADTWYLTSNITGGAAPISSNLSRMGFGGFALLGTGMTQSSGVFTFPSTGHWEITFQALCQGSNISDGSYFMTHIGVTENDSSWVDVDSHGACIIDHSTSVNASAMSKTILDVTDVTTHKVRFATQVSDSAMITGGSASELQTCMFFIRLADT